MFSIMKSILFNSWVSILFYLTVINDCKGDICSTCLCSITGIENVINCHEKLFKNNNTIQLNSLVLDQYPNVEEVILSKNNITLVLPNLFMNLKHLKKLDLSDNLLSEIYSNAFASFNNLNDLIYSNNKLKVFDNVIFETISTINKLNLSHNSIEMLKSTISKPVKSLITLDISHNNIISINDEFLKPFLHLQYLDLSFNKISSIPDNTFLRFLNLKTLVINNNFLTSLKFKELPTNLTELHIGHNKIVETLYELSQIKVLNIEYNNISQLEANISLLHNLEHLNVSGNALTRFPDIKLQKLEVLDISNNNYSNIPNTLSFENFPSLSTLIVSGNPIKNLMFYSKLKLQLFVANDIISLEHINKDTFLKLAPINDCINLTISNNKRLIFIDEMALDHINVCFVDLSNNNVDYISPKLLLSNDTLKMRNGIDLQGNPFACNCSLQWMLTTLIPQLYSINPRILNNLRCATPLNLLNKRMVHWYKWQRQIFCEDVSKLSDFSEKLTEQVEGVSNKKIIMFESTSGLLAVLGTAIILLTLLVVIGILLTQKLERKRSRKNRRF